MVRVKECPGILLVCGFWCVCLFVLLFPKTHTNIVGGVAGKQNRKPRRHRKSLGLLKPCSSYIVGEWALHVFLAYGLIFTTDISFGYMYPKIEVKKGEWSEFRVELPTYRRDIVHFLFNLMWPKQRYWGVCFAIIGWKTRVVILRVAGHLCTL